MSNDITFCARDCGDKSCRRNKCHVPTKREIEILGLSVSWASFDDCDDYRATCKGCQHDQDKCTGKSHKKCHKEE